MKTIIISCNYFAMSENRLKNCLESLKMVKLPNTVILMGDNNSTDGSVELIQEYVDNGTIDVFYKSPKNIGKAKMLNTLYYVAKTKIGVDPDDVLMHIDSDIVIKNKNYLKIVEDYYSNALANKQTIVGVFPFVEEKDRKGYYLFDVLNVPEIKEYGFLTRTAPHRGIAGGCFSTLCKYHEEIGGYVFRQGENGNPIYGGDDGFYMIGLSNIQNHQFKIISSLDIFIQDEPNKQYQAWKFIMNNNIPSKVMSDNSGFFDLNKSKLNIHVPDKTYDFKMCPHVDVIILTKDHVDLLASCINSIIEKTKYIDYRIIIGDTGSTDSNLNYIKKFICNKSNIKLITNLEYRFGRLNNQLVNMFNDQSENSLLLFCNNDIEFLNDCISEMVYAHENNENVGTIGARLHYPDGKIQHAGIAVDSNGGLTHIDAHSLPSKFILNSNCIYKNPYEYVVGSTGALLMISRKHFFEVNGFNENYKVCFEDVELNMQMIKLGYKNIVDYDAVAIHKESQTRGKELDRADIQRYFNFFKSLNN